jgi:5'-nucleotidase
MFHDVPTIDALNAMNLAVTSIGNHELDHGPAELLRRIQGGCLAEAG